MKAWCESALLAGGHDDWHVVLPPKDAVYHDMESLIYHFKLVMEGRRNLTEESIKKFAKGLKLGRGECAA